MGNCCVCVTVLGAVNCVPIVLWPAIAPEVVCVVGVDHSAVSIIGVVEVVDAVVVVVPVFVIR